MRRARRLLSVAVVASLAVTGLSACRSAPSVAAYIGADKITESRVTDMYNEVYDAVTAATPPKPGEQVAMPITRNDVARVLVSSQVLPEVAKKQNVTLPADLPIDNYSTALHIPAGTEFVKLFAQSDAYVSLLKQKVTSAPALNDADLRAVYDALLKTGQLTSDTSFEQFKSALPQENTQAVQAAAAVRDQITQVAGAMNLTINPRYEPMGIPVLLVQTQEGGVTSLLDAPLGSGESSVPVSAAH
jgi:hypothetical protein